MARPAGDADVPEPPIRFGTSGWRGILGEDFTFARLRTALHGVGRWLAREAPGGEVVIAHDTRFLGERMAAIAETVLAGHGLRPLRAAGATPTPAAGRAVRRRGAAGGVVLTASHNPPEYQGLKVFGPGGAGIDDAAARAIEALARGAPCAPVSPATGRGVDLRRPYRRELLRRLDRERLAASRLTVVYDAMHGAGAGVLDAVLEDAGLRVRRLRDAPDARFGGGAPDPGAERLRELARVVRGLRGRRIGLATDGDADRFAVLDADGRLLDETEALALLVDHLARDGRVRRGVAVSVATGSLVARVAEAHGLALSRHPIGFKHLARALESGAADVAGEESGGFALASFGRDKDGMLAAALCAEIAASGPLAERLVALRARHGRADCGRVAIAAAPRHRDVLAALRERPPARVDGRAVLRTSREDGLHLALEDGFLMLRASGTEPVVRVYAEASGRRALARRLRAGAQLLERKA